MVTVDEDAEPILLAVEPVTPAGARASLARLSAGERARVASIRHSGRADAVAVSLALTRQLVATVTGLPPAGLVFARTCLRCGHLTHGRPRLVPGVADFSVSRSELWAAVEVAPVAVGVDVEDPGRPVAAGELAPALSAAERRWLAGRDAEELLGLWVMKEAAGKAMGLGIVAAEEFSVVARQLTTCGAGGRWRPRRTAAGA